MGFVRLQTVKYLLALLLLCACAPGRVVMDSNAVPSPAPTFIPTDTKASPSPKAEATSVVFQGPLSVIIQSPADNAIVPVSPVEIKGEADPDTVITINDAIILVDEKRAFTVLLPLQPGANIIEITASDAEGKQGFAYLTLLYEP